MRIVFGVALLAAGCTGDTNDDKTDVTDVTDQTDTVDPTGDSGSCVPQFAQTCKDYDAKGKVCGELSRTGSGVVKNYQAKGTSYAGSEAIQLTSLQDKSVVCRITYDFVAGTDRSDECPMNCEWAFEFTTANVTVETNVNDACDGVFGALEICDETELEGLTLVRGYDPDWEGHAQVIWTVNASDEWEVVSFSKFDSKSGTLNYTWFDGIYPY